MSRMPSGKPSLLDLNEIFKETSSLLEYEAKKQGTEIVTLLSEEPAKLMGSDPELRMAAVNLIQNALHAVNSGGKVTLKTFVAENEVTACIEDTGCGIAIENLQRIFEPFFSEQRTENEKSGTGLGLPITKTIIENHGGRIVVESTLNVGTTIILRFQRAKKDGFEKEIV